MLSVPVSRITVFTAIAAGIVAHDLPRSACRRAAPNLLLDDQPAIRIRPRRGRWTAVM